MEVSRGQSVNYFQLKPIMVSPDLATEEEWDSVFTINAKGTFLCYKHAGRQMIAQGRGGRIIGASSIAGKRGEVCPVQSIPP